MSNDVWSYVWPLGHGPLGPTFAEYSVGQPFSTYEEVEEAIPIVQYCQLEIDSKAINREQLEAAASALLDWLYEERRRLRPPPIPARPICKVPVFLPMHHAVHRH